MFVEDPFVSHQQLQPNQLESFVLEPRDDPTDEAALDTVRLDHDVGPLNVGHAD